MQETDSSLFGQSSLSDQIYSGAGFTADKIIEAAINNSDFADTAKRSLQSPIQQKKYSQLALNQTELNNLARSEIGSLATHPILKYYLLGFFEQQLGLANITLAKYLATSHAALHLAYRAGKAHIKVIDPHRLAIQQEFGIFQASFPLKKNSAPHFKEEDQQILFSITSQKQLPPACVIVNWQVNYDESTQQIYFSEFNLSLQIAKYVVSFANEMTHLKTFYLGFFELANQQDYFSYLTEQEINQCLTRNLHLQLFDSIKNQNINQFLQLSTKEIDLHFRDTEQNNILHHFINFATKGMFAFFAQFIYDFPTQSIQQLLTMPNNKNQTPLELLFSQSSRRQEKLKLALNLTEPSKQHSCKTVELLLTFNNRFHNIRKKNYSAIEAEGKTPFNDNLIHSSNSFRNN